MSDDEMEKLLADRKLTLELTPEARALIAREGYDPAFGARPLKRAIQRLLQNPLALAVLADAPFDVLYERPDQPTDARLAAIVYLNPKATGPHFHIQRRKGTQY